MEAWVVGIRGSDDGGRCGHERQGEKLELRGEAREVSGKRGRSLGCFKWLGAGHFIGGARMPSRRPPCTSGRGSDELSEHGCKIISFGGTSTTL